MLEHSLIGNVHAIELNGSAEVENAAKTDVRARSRSFRSGLAKSSTTHGCIRTIRFRNLSVCRNVRIWFKSQPGNEVLPFKKW